jgi:hypothetical protein
MSDYKIHRDDVLELVEEIKAHVPTFQIAYKEDGKWLKWWHYVVPMYVAIANFFVRGYKHKFDTGYVTVLGDTVYYPSRNGHVDELEFLSEPGNYKTLRHEYVHMRDARRYPFIFELTYLFLLPALWTMRAFWEYRGYTQNMIVEFEIKGAVANHTLEAIAENFTGPMYLWMDRDPMPKLKELRDQVQSGKLSGFYPY